MKSETHLEELVSLPPKLIVLPSDWRSHVGANGHGTSGLAHQSDAIGVPAEVLDVPETVPARKTCGVPISFTSGRLFLVFLLQLFGEFWVRVIG